MHNKPVLKTVEQFMSDYTPVYQPIYPLFLGKSQAYDMEVGKQEFRRVQTVGDIRGKNITPKDSELRQIGAMTSKKAFKKYFFANQYINSDLADPEGIQEIAAQVLDEHQIHQDELFLLGEGTSDSTMINNGLFWSNDPNYSLENSTAIAASGRLLDFHAKVVSTVEQANAVAGRKIVMFYGTSILPLFNSLHESGAKPVKEALAQVLGPNVSFVQMPAACTPSGANGWIAANLDQTKLHYTKFPQLLKNGVNEEKMYSWFNFILGSTMLEVLAADGIVRQPATLA